MIRRVLAVAALTAAGVLAAPGAASAHVTVQADTTAPGATATLTFSVPSESATAATTVLAVRVPASLTRLDPAPRPGWTARVAAGTVTWTAAPGRGVRPGATGRFALRAGPLPPGPLALPATQTYDDGRVVAWNEQAADGTEPEHPAPALTVAAAAPRAHGAPAAGGDVAPRTPAGAWWAPAAAPAAGGAGGGG
ncbi:DUF1775 domain-containing protein, partial [Actinomadura parmotrematis]